jgi:hypothetical protein
MESYRERLTAPPSWWLTALIFGGICGWIMRVAADPTWGLVTTALATAVGVALVWAYGGLTIRAGADGLHVGDALLPASAVGGAVALDRLAFRASLGPEADARAWLRTRPYIGTGVRVTVDDPDDPAPYWLISARRPEAVIAALGRSVVQTEAAHNEGIAG